MQTSQTISATRTTFQEAILDFLWRQWTQLGVSGTSVGRDSWAIDLEVLLAYSLHASRRDPRLFDETLDWLVHNASLVSTQRLHNRVPKEIEPVVRASIAWAGHHGAAPFRSRRHDRLPPRPLERLFRVDGGPLHVEQPDAVFERFGLLRPAVDPSGKSRPPDPLLPSNLAVRLRLLFGLGTRAEALRVLLAMGTRVSTTELSRLAGYARRNVEEALAALREAGVVSDTRRARRREWWTDRQRWSDLLGVDVTDLPRFVDWEALFTALRKIDGWLEEDASSPRTDYMRASTARELIDEIRDDLSVAGVRTPIRVDAATALQALRELIDALVSFLSGPRTDARGRRPR